MLISKRINYAHFGNGLSVWFANTEVKIAHISKERVIEWKLPFNKITPKEKSNIEYIAKYTNPEVAYSQNEPVFSDIGGKIGFTPNGNGKYAAKILTLNDKEINGCWIDNDDEIIISLNYNVTRDDRDENWILSELKYIINRDYPKGVTISSGWVTKSQAWCRFKIDKTIKK